VEDNLPPKRPSVFRIKPIRRPQYKVTWTNRFRPLSLPPSTARRLSPTAIEERLLKVIAARSGTGTR